MRREPAAGRSRQGNTMLSWFKALLPHEARFFVLFAQHSQTIVSGAEALQGVLRGGDEVPAYCQKVSQFEQQPS